MTHATIAPSRTSRSRSLAGWMAAGVCLSVALLSWFGYRAARDSQLSARLLLEENAPSSVLYLRVNDIAAAFAALQAHGVKTEGGAW